MARLNRTLPLRSARRFRRIRGRDRALLLAGQAFTTLLPVMIIAAGIIGRSRGSGLAEGLVERFRLGGVTADALRTLFTRPPHAAGVMSVTSLVVLVFSVLGFTRALQTTYEEAWDMSPCGMRGTLNGLGGTGLLVAQVIVLAMLVSLLRGLPALPVAGTVVRVGLAFPLWLALQHLLLSRRASVRVLWPGALLAAVGQGLVTLGSGLWMPPLVARNEARYGVIGVTFALLTWLIILAFTIVLAAVVGAELGVRRTATADPGAVLARAPRAPAPSARGARPEPVPGGGEHP